MTESQQDTKHGFAALVAAAMALAWALPAVAQWAWRDENGRQVYSDRPPPASIKPSQITQQPSRQVVIPIPAAPAAGTDDAAKAAAPDAKAAQPAAPKTTAEREMEFRKRQQERADSEKKAQEEQQKASAKAAECERAKGYLKSLEDGVRVSRTDASGNREILDDAQRAAEVERTRKIVQSTCG
jgi:type IV secretory pathway VirB10-like protein